MQPPDIGLDASLTSSSAFDRWSQLIDLIRLPVAAPGLNARTNNKSNFTFVFRSIPPYLIQSVRHVYRLQLCQQTQLCLVPGSRGPADRHARAALGYNTVGSHGTTKSIKAGFTGGLCSNSRIKWPMLRAPKKKSIRQHRFATKQAHQCFYGDP